MSVLPTDPLSPLRRDFGLNMVRMARLWRNVVDHELRKFGGLTASTWRPLFYIGMLGDGVRPKDLAMALDIERPSLVQLLDRLENQGYVQRRDAVDDRRSKTLHLTPQGREIYERTIHVSTVLADQLTDGVSDQDMTHCLEIFRRVHANIGKMPSAAEAT